MSNVIIDLDKIKDNTMKIVNKYSTYKHYIAVVKTDAYGLGLDIVPSLIEGGVNYLAVSYLDEAIKVRKMNKLIPVLCMQPISKEDISVAISNNITITVSSFDYLTEILPYIRSNVKVHLKIDSGMNRLGFKTKEELDEAISLIKDNSYITVEGIYTHFATIGYIDPLYDRSIERFKDVTSSIDLDKIPIVHFGGSAALMAHPKLPYVNGFRSGILFMGYNVSLKESNSGVINKVRLIRNNLLRRIYKISDTFRSVHLPLEGPVSFYTNVIDIKMVNKGEAIGYGSKTRADKDMLIAILPVGEADGIKRNVNRYVVINNNKYYAVGPVSMNMMSVIVDNKVKIGDKVELIGSNISLGEFASFNREGLAETLINFRNSNRIYK